MIVVMRPGCTQADVEHVVQLVKDFGLTDHVIVGTDRTVVAAIGDKRNVDKGAFEAYPAVEKIVPTASSMRSARSGRGERSR